MRRPSKLSINRAIELVERIEKTPSFQGREGVITAIANELDAVIEDTLDMYCGDTDD